MEKEFNPLFEIIENCSHTIKLLIKGEIALNDGDVAACQKYTNDVKNIMSVLVRDVFIEVSEEFSLPVEDSADYDLPSSLELANQLSEIVYHACSLANMINESENESIKTLPKRKLSSHIFAAREIYNLLFNN